MTPKPISVSLAQPGDEELLFALICASDDEWSFGKPDPDKIRGVIRSAIDGDERVRPYFGVIAGPSVIEGAIGLFPTESWNSSDTYIRAFWQFVHPLYRKSRHAVDLRDFAKWFGDVAGMQVLFELPRIDQTEAKARMYERGAEWVGGMFMYRQPALEAVA